ADVDTEALQELRLTQCHISRDVEHLARLVARRRGAVAVRAGLSVGGQQVQLTAGTARALRVLPRDLFVAAAESAQPGLAVQPAEQLELDEDLPVLQDQLRVLEPALDVDRLGPLALDVRQQLQEVALTGSGTLV